MKKKYSPPPQLSDFPKTLTKEARMIACQKAHAQWFKLDQAKMDRKWLHIDRQIVRYLRDQAASKLPK